jgi:hypothetical protein
MRLNAIYIRITLTAVIRQRNITTFNAPNNHTLNHVEDIDIHFAVTSPRTGTDIICILKEQYQPKDTGHSTNIHFIIVINILTTWMKITKVFYYHRHNVIWPIEIEARRTKR